MFCVLVIMSACSGSSSSKYGYFTAFQNQHDSSITLSLVNEADVSDVIDFNTIEPGETTDYYRSDKTADYKLIINDRVTSTTVVLNDSQDFAPFKYFAKFIWVVDDESIIDSITDSNVPITE